MKKISFFSFSLFFGMAFVFITASRPCSPCEIENVNTVSAGPFEFEYPTIPEEGVTQRKESSCPSLETSDFSDVTSSTLIWQRSSAGDNLPSWFGSHTERGIAVVQEGDNIYMLIQSAEADTGPPPDPDEPLVYYLAVTGNDSNNGLSRSSPLKTLERVHQILQAEQPDRNIEVRIGPGRYRGQTVLWTWTRPNRTIRFTRDTDERPIFDGCISDSNCPGGEWFRLSHTAGERTNLDFDYIRVENYQTAISLNGNRNNAETGNNSHNRIFGCYFYRIGNVFNPSLDPSTATVRLVNSTDNYIVNNHFVDVINTTSLNRIHAIYIAHHSSRNEILRNRFANNSGDAVRLRDLSNDNVINENTFIQAGQFAGYTDWYCDSNVRDDCTKATQECPSWNNQFRDNILRGNFQCDRLKVFEYFQGDSPNGCETVPSDWRRLRTSNNLVSDDCSEPGSSLAESALPQKENLSSAPNMYVRIVNAKTGADVGTMNLSNYHSGGTFHFSDISVSEDNRIFLANYTRYPFDEYGKFRVWMYENTTDTQPVLVLDDSRPDEDENWRLSRTLTVTGDYAAGTATLYAMVDGSTGASRNMIRYTQSGPGEPFDVSAAYTTTVWTQFNPSVSAAEAGAAPFYTNSGGQQVRKYDENRTYLGMIGSAVVPASTNRVQFIGTCKEGDDYIGVFNYATNQAKLVRVPGGNPASAGEADVVEVTPSLGSLSNPNNAGDIHFVYNGNGSEPANFTVYVLGTNNGIAAFETQFEVELDMPGADPDPDPNRITEIPYTEDFSGVSVPGLPDGWANIGDVVTFDGWTAIGGTTLEFPAGIAGDDHRIAVLPEIDEAIDISDLKVEFNVQTPSTAGDERIEVGFLTDPADPATFTLIESVSLLADGAVLDAEASLAGHIGANGRFLALKAESPSDWNRFFIGYVELSEGTPVVSSELGGSLPEQLFLSQNYPNPFNPVTVISYAVPEESRVRLAVYDVTGRKIALLVDEHQNPGNYDLTWDASGFSSGVYIYQLEANGQNLTRRMTLLK